MTEQDSYVFENEVRRIARALWPQAEFQGSGKEENREYDGIFVTEEVVHLIEATISPKKDKAEHDILKLVELSRKLKSRYRDRLIRCWFITRQEPTADQRGVAERFRSQANLTVLSYDQFAQKLINVASYLEARKKHPFGSMDVSEKEVFKYVELDFFSNDQQFLVDDIVNQLLNAARFVLRGDYGSGKSTTMRELFLRLQSRYFAQKTTQFPILLNLNEHYGQTDVAEALERHARKVGYDTPSHLVRALNAGRVILLLDGFDELATPGWSGQAKRLKDLRFQSMYLIRQFLAVLPRESGIVIAGRVNYFNSTDEMRAALGLDTTFKLLTVNDFNEDQINAYLKHRNLTDTPPAWLPSRPLLLGKIVSWGLVTKIASLKEINPVEGWDQLMTMICEREAKQTQGSMDGIMVRQLLERLASKTRISLDRLGTLAPDTISETFREVSGYSADDKVAVLLLRLPGLGAPNAEDGSRQFIDEALMDVARVGDVLRYIEDPYHTNIKTEDEWISTLGRLGCQLTAHKCQTKTTPRGKIRTAIEQLSRTRRIFTIAADLVKTLDFLDEPYDGDRIYISGILFDQFSWENDEQDLSQVVYQDCLFQQIEIPPGMNAVYMPLFVRCHFEIVDGRLSPDDLPKDKFVDCKFGEFANTVQTTNAILALSLPVKQKVLLSILRKLYLQSGNGRMDSALRRGLDQQMRVHVGDILQVLESEGLVTRMRSRSYDVWLPVRSEIARVNQLLSAPATSKDPILQRVI